MTRLEDIERDARALRVPMTHVPNDAEYLEVLAYRVQQQLDDIARKSEKLRELREQIEIARFGERVLRRYVVDVRAYEHESSFTVDAHDDDDAIDRACQVKGISISIRSSHGIASDGTHVALTPQEPRL